MKKIFTTIATIAMLATLAVSCQKENFVGETVLSAESISMRTVSYVVDGEVYRISIADDEAWHLFLDRMMALAEEGREVRFGSGETNWDVLLSKKSEMVTYSTPDYDDAYSWMDKMTSLGYAVMLRYDKAKKLYICIAIR